MSRWIKANGRVLGAMHALSDAGRLVDCDEHKETPDPGTCESCETRMSAASYLTSLDRAMFDQTWTAGQIETHVAELAAMTWDRFVPDGERWFPPGPVYACLEPGCGNWSNVSPCFGGSCCNDRGIETSVLLGDAKTLHPKVTREQRDYLVAKREQEAEVALAQGQQRALF